MHKCPAATKGVPPPRQRTEKSEARIANLTARFQNGKPYFTEPLSQWHRAYRVSLCRHDRPVILTFQFYQLQICSWTCTHNAENSGEIPARRTGRDLPPAYTQVDEFSQSTLGAHACTSAPLQQRVCHRPANTPKNVKFALQTCRQGSRMASRTSLNQCRGENRVDRIRLARLDRPQILAIQLSHLQICSWICTHNH